MNRSAALYRDFGLDAQRNGEHAAAFIEGMRAGGVGSAIKHYPGLGSVRGNTDFTANGIVDDTTTENGTEVNAFTSAIRQGKPAMVMVSLATYKLIDPDNPAAFSPAIVTDMLRRGTPVRRRGDLGFPLGRCRELDCSTGSGRAVH